MEYRRIPQHVDHVAKTRGMSGSRARTDADEERVVILVTRDVLAIVGPGFEHIVAEEGARIRLFAEAVLEYEQRLIDDVQQRLHDEFVSTT